MMSLVYGKLKEDIKDAMRAKNKFLLTIFRTLDSSIQMKAMDIGSKITDEIVYEVAKKSMKIVKEEIEQAHKFGYIATEITKKEEESVLSKYLPNELNQSETEALVDTAIQSQSATSIRDMGKVMAHIKKEYGMNVDMTIVSSMVKNKLQ
jgi:uncharacterized protein